MTLRVQTDIPHGNACDVEVREGPEGAEVRFAADPHGGPECLWWCFRLLAGAPAPGRVKLVWKHMDNILGASMPEKVLPVACYEGADWQRLPAGRRDELPDGRVSGAWEIDAPRTFVDLAVCYPYGPAEVETLLRETGGFYRAEAIGVSQGGRPIVRLSNGPGEVGSDRPGVHLIARQHSGEAPGSWLVDGFLRGVASMGDRAPLVWAVPLANIDGVQQGDYGKDNYPYDLNRAWGAAPMRHETLVIERDMRRWRQRCRPVLCIDSHAPAANEAEGIYSSLPAAETSAEMAAAVREWIDRVGEALGEYAAKDFGRDTSHWISRWPTPTYNEFCRAELGTPSLLLETPYSLVRDIVMTREHYRQAGRRLAACVAGAAGQADRSAARTPDGRETPS